MTNEAKRSKESGSTVELERETIIKMAVAAGFSHAPPKFKHWRGTISDLERFAELVADAVIRGRSNKH